MYDSSDHFNLTLGEDGLPCRHPSVDWLGTAATCPECGTLLFPLKEDPQAKSLDSKHSPEDPSREDLPDVPFDPEADD